MREEVRRHERRWMGSQPPTGAVLFKTKWTGGDERMSLVAERLQSIWRHTSRKCRGGVVFTERRRRSDAALT